MRLNKFAFTMLFIPFLLIACSSTDDADAGSKKTVAATDEDIYLYRGIGSSYVCNARNAGLEFPKAVGIAAASYTQLLNGRHGGKIAAVGNKRLTNKQLFTGAEFQIITGAIQYCSKHVPKDVQAKVKNAIEGQGLASGSYSGNRYLEPAHEKRRRAVTGVNSGILMQQSIQNLGGY